MLKDKYARQREKMIEKLRNEANIKDERVLKAMNEIERHKFVSSAFWSHIYQDKAFKIAEDQTISHPSTVAYQTELLELKKTDKVLEIGTGSGYQACVLYKMGVKVYTIERIKKLYLSTKKFLEKEMGIFRINMKFGDGYEGWEEFAPFDKIIVTAAAPEIPQKLYTQLAVGGMMVIPYGEDGGEQQILRITKKNVAGNYDIEHLKKVRFVPMLKGDERVSRYRRDDI